MSFQHFRNQYQLNDLLDECKRFSDRLEEIKNKLNRPSTDERYSALFDMQCAFLSLGLPIYAMAGNGLKTRKRSKEEVWESMSGYAIVGGGTPEEMMIAVERGWRLNLLVQFHFNLGFLFEVLLKKLSKKTYIGFKRNKKALLEEIPVKNHDQANRNIDMLTYIRNTLHTGGKHVGDSVPAFPIDDLIYELKIGEPCECSSFEHIFTLMDPIIDVIDEILQKPKISELL